MTFYVNYITYLLVTLMSSVVRYSGHYNLILRTIQYYIPNFFIPLVYNNLKQLVSANLSELSGSETRARPQSMNVTKYSRKDQTSHKVLKQQGI